MRSQRFNTIAVCTRSGADETAARGHTFNHIFGAGNPLLSNTNESTVAAVEPDGNWFAIDILIEFK